MLETIIVVAIMAVVLVLAGRSFHRTLAGKNSRCGCGGSCLNCPSKDSLTKVHKSGCDS
jgi:hypothetical protein